MNITVFGLGYVGLTTAVGLAEMGHTVTGVDIDTKKMALLKKGVAPFFEPDLEKLLKKHAGGGGRGGVKKRLSFANFDSLAVQKLLAESDAVFCAVAGRSEKKGRQNGDDASSFQAVLSVARTFAKHAGSGALFVNKSTVPVGSSEKIAAVVGAERFVSTPEFLRQGSAVQDTLRPDRIVVGVADLGESGGKSFQEKVLRQIYAPLLKKKVPLVVTDLRSAELIKYASNAFLATRISFINEMAQLCKKTGGNMQDIVRGMGYDPRIGHQFLRPGIGFGGSCLPRDLRALLQTGQKAGAALPLLQAVETVNNQQPLLFLAQLKKRLKTLKGKKIAVWGLAFKPNTDDLRAAPSVTIVQQLLKEKAQVQVYDPQAMNRFRELFGGQTLVQKKIHQTGKNSSLLLYYGKNKYDILKNADALLVLTEWEEFRCPNFARMKKLMKQPVILDGRSLYNPEK